MNGFKVFIACLMLAFPANAQQDQVRVVIESQIEALLADDFETAFTFAAPNIKQMFGTSAYFGMMVAKGYPMVHRPADFLFKDMRPDTDGVVQNVLIRDVQGDYYIAEYSLIETENGWKISGVTVLQAPGVGA